MFARAVFGLAVWVGMTGAAAAQLPVPTAAPRGSDVSAKPTLFPRGESAPAMLPPTFGNSHPTATGAQLGRPATVGEAPASRGARLSQPVAHRVADETPKAAAPAALPDYVPGVRELAGCCNDACAEPCGPEGRTWVSAEWLYWVTSGQTLPELVTTAPPGTARTTAGVLGAGTTSVLYGGDRANNNFRNGFRVTAGMWLDDAQTLGIGGDFFFLASTRDGFAAASNGSQILTRPYVNALTGMPDVELVSFPGVLAGSVEARAKSSFLGAGVNGIANLCCDPCGRLDLLVGYRYLNLVDKVRVQEDLTALAGQTAVPAGTRFLITDKFTARNNFHGGLLGLSGERRFGHFFVGGRAAVSLGTNIQTVNITGSTTIIRPGVAPQVFAGGLLTQPTNIGKYEQSKFAVAPEVGLRLGMQVTESARAFVGYDFLYLSNVVRAGDQIDPRVNPNLLPPRTVTGGPALPTFSPKTTDFWAHGITAGLELRF